MRRPAEQPNEPSFSFAELTAILGLPWHWAVSYTRDHAGERGIKPTVKVAGQARLRYNHAQAAKFLMAKYLSAQKLSRRTVLYTVNHFQDVTPARPLDELAKGVFVIVEQEATKKSTPLIVWFGPEQMNKFSACCSVLSRSPYTFAFIFPDNIFETLRESIDCWQRGVEMPKSTAGDQVRQALSELRDQVFVEK